MIPSRQGSFAARGLAVLQNLGGWVAIQPEQTYVATSIRGLGDCKSTFCPAERRELQPVRRAGVGLVPLLAALAAAAGILTACASDRPFSRDVTDLGKFERAPADCQVDCQNRAAPVRGGVIPGTEIVSASAAGRMGTAQAIGLEIAGTTPIPADAVVVVGAVGARGTRAVGVAAVR